MPYPYPQRGNIPNGLQIAGQAFRDVGQSVGNLSDKQARLRASFEEAVKRRQEAALARLKYEEEQRRHQVEEKRRDEEMGFKRKAEDRAAADATKPKPYQPTTMDEALEFDRKKRENALSTRPPKGPSEGDKSRLREQANAKKMLPAVWEKIDRMWQKRPEAKEIPMVDPTTFQPILDPKTRKPYMRRDPGYEQWQRNMANLQKELNDAETAAGYPVTRSPFTEARSQSQSFLEYAQSAYPGKHAKPAPPPAASTGNMGSMHRTPMEEVSAAEEWLRNNPTPPPGMDPKDYAKFVARLKSLSGISNQMPFPEAEEDSLGF